jgi:flagellin
LISLKTNMMTQNAVRHMNSHFNKLSDLTMMISSGNRLYSAKEDPAGMAINSSLRSDIASLDVKIRQAYQRIDSMSNGSSSHQGQSEVLISLKVIAEQISTGTYSESQKNILVNQFNEYVEQLDFIHNLAVDIANGDSDLRKLATENLAGEDLLSGPDAVMEELDRLVKTNSSAAAAFGTDIRRLESRIDWMSNTKLNLEEAASSIADVDIATAMVEYTKEMVLVQVAIAMAAQSNNIHRDIALSLLEVN